MSETATYTRIFGLAGLSIEVKSDLPFNSDTFASKFDMFETSSPLEENIVLHHHFSSDLVSMEVDSAKKVYFRPPWAIYEQDEKWVYQWIQAEEPYANYHQAMVTDREHTHLHIYNDEAMKDKFLKGGLESLTMFPTDQILTGRLLAYRDGCIMHSLGIILGGNGYLFVGHSDAGKSTMATMMKNHALILCDDRNIIRKMDGTFQLSGTWSHGDIPDVSSRIAPLKAIFFLQQSDVDQIEPLDDQVRVFESLLACLIRPLETRDWWEKSMEFLTMVSEEVACCNLKFTKNGEVVDLITAYDQQKGELHG